MKARNEHACKANNKPNLVCLQGHAKVIQLKKKLVNTTHTHTRARARTYIATGSMIRGFKSG
jgi:hypothetical protein